MEAYAIRYASAERIRSTVFADHDEPDGPIQLDFFTWVIRAGSDVVAVDTGASREDATRNGLDYFGDPVVGLTALGIDARDIHDLVITHLHYDHAGNLGHYPDATLHLHRAELDFWRGPRSAHATFQRHASPHAFEWIDRAAESGRLKLVEGPTAVGPGIRVIPGPGHTPGQLLVEVTNGPDRILLASDAVHHDEELARGRAHALHTDLADLEATYEWIRAAEMRVIPGHDVSVTRDFPVVATVGDISVHRLM